MTHYKKKFYALFENDNSDGAKQFRVKLVTRDGHKHRVKSYWKLIEGYVVKTIADKKYFISFCKCPRCWVVYDYETGAFVSALDLNRDEAEKVIIHSPSEQWAIFDIDTQKTIKNLRRKQKYKRYEE